MHTIYLFKLQENKNLYFLDNGVQIWMKDFLCQEDKWKNFARMGFTI